MSASEIVRGWVGNACSAEKVIAPLEVVVDGLLAHGRVDVGEAAELVIVVDLVPRDVEGDGRGKGRVLVHLGGIRDLLLRGSRGSRCAEHLESGARVAEGPGANRDAQDRRASKPKLAAGHRSAVLGRPVAR